VFVFVNAIVIMRASSLFQVDFFLDFAAVELVARYDDGLEAALNQLEQHLATRTFFVGHDYTLADSAVWGGLKGMGYISGH